MYYKDYLFVGLLICVKIQRPFLIVSSVLGKAGNQMDLTFYLLVVEFLGVFSRLMGHVNLPGNYPISSFDRRIPCS